MKVIEANLIGKGLKIAIVVSRFNDFVTNRLLEGAKDTLLRHGVKEEDICVVWVPGSFEIPLIVKELALTKRYDGIIALGAVIRGDTPHFNYIASEVTKGIANVTLSERIPVAFGILTCDTLEQAIQRAGLKTGNKGQEAALSVIEMANLLKNLKE